MTQRCLVAPGLQNAQDQIMKSPRMPAELHVMLRLINSDRALKSVCPAWAAGGFGPIQNIHGLLLAATDTVHAPPPAPNCPSSLLIRYSLDSSRLTKAKT